MFPWNFSPFQKDSLNMMKGMKQEHIEKYVQDMLGKMMPQQMQGFNFEEIMGGFQSMVNQQPHAFSTPKNEPLKATVFETHDDVYVKSPIAEQHWMNNMRIYHTSNQLIIEHIPEEKDKHTITLPAIVKKKGATTQLQDGILEIKLQKNIDLQYSEIDIKL